MFLVFEAIKRRPKRLLSALIFTSFSSDCFTCTFFAKLAKVLIFILGSASQNPTALLLIFFLIKAFISFSPSFSAWRSREDTSLGITTPVARFESAILSPLSPPCSNESTMTDSKVDTSFLTSSSSLCTRDWSSFFMCRRSSIAANTTQFL